MNQAWIVGLFLALFVNKGTGQTSDLTQGKGKNNYFDSESINGNMTSNQISLKSSTWLKFVSNYAARAQWTSIVFYFSNYSEFSINLASVIFNHFNSEGRFVAIHTTSRALLPLSILHLGHKLGIVYYCDIPDEEFLNKVADMNLFDPYRSWLIIKPEMPTGKSRLEELLRHLNLGLKTDMVIGKMERRSGTAPTTATTPTVANLIRDSRISLRKKRELPGDLNVVVHLVQVRDPITEEHRWNLGGYKVHIGVKNSSQLALGAPLTQPLFSVDRDMEEGKNFMELFRCIIYGINASFELIQFQKLGWKNEEGGWTHLLGGVVDETVDFALETINANVDKSEDLSFTYAIITTMNNIYFRRPTSGGLRNIFLAPFSPKLVFYVVSTSFLLAVAMISVTVFNYRNDCETENSVFAVLNGSKIGRTVLMTSNDNKKWKISDAALWSVSILCMQGSQWSPKSISGNLVLINGLLFALVIYNAFAAFITSVLSVKTIHIKDLKDLADSDFAFGYTLGNADELFLRTVNNTLLRELYFKGLRENDGVSNSIVGMNRAAKGKYAFFVSARTARRALRTTVAHDKRCLFQELSLSVTKNYASIPMNRKSPLKKIINLKILRLMETGILRRFQGLILLSMPRCVERTTFNSARLADVYSAFFLLAGGWACSLLILLTEVLWRRRRKKKATDAAGIPRPPQESKLNDKKSIYRNE